MGFEKRYDIVFISGGYVGVNHYQTAKAAVAASRVVRQGGIIILIAENTDPDPIGGVGYNRALPLLKRYGHKKFMEMILKPGWEMIPEQWKVQMWCKVLDIIEKEKNVIYCALEIPEKQYRDIPCQPSVLLLENRFGRGKEKKKLLMKEMVEKALSFAIERLRKGVYPTHRSFF